jgi:hypothetical protein
MKSKHGEEEIKWMDLVLTSIADTHWVNVFEVWEKFSAIIPPHMIYRKKRDVDRRGGNRTPVTVRSMLITRIGSTIRYAIRHKWVERTVPIRTSVNNIGNYSLRLTAAGKARAQSIKSYFCRGCFHVGITRARNAVCGHCCSRHLTFYHGISMTDPVETKQQKPKQRKDK